MQASAAIRLSWGTTLETGPRQTTFPGSNSSRNVDHGILEEEPVIATEPFLIFSQSSSLSLSSYPFRTVFGRLVQASGLPQAETL